MYNKKDEALALLRDIAQTSDYYTARRVWHAHHLVSGKPSHRRYKTDWGFIGWLAFGFVLVFVVAYFRQ